MAESATASSRSTACPPAVAVAVTVLFWSSSFPGIRAALEPIEVSRAVTALYLVSPMATILGAVWLHELPSSLALAGGTVAIAGVIVVNTLGKASHGR